MAAARAPHRGPVVVTFAVHAVIGFAVLLTAGIYGPDAVTYDRIARDYVAFWDQAGQVRPALPAGKEGWVLVLACVYRWFGAYPALGIIINVTLTGVTAALVMATTARLGWARHARTAGYLMLLPGFLLWPSLLLRESLVWTLTALAAWAAAGLGVKGGVRDTLWLLTALVGVLWVRGSLVAVIGAGLLAGVVLGLRRPPLAVAVPLVAALVTGSPLVARAVALSGGADVDRINLSRASLSRSASGFETTVYRDPREIVRDLPVTAPRAMFGPYPWELPRLPLTALVDWTAWMLLSYLAWRGWRRVGGSLPLLVVVPTLGLLAVIGATSGNYGTMVRLRSQAAVVLLPLAAVGVSGGRHAATTDSSVRRRPVAARAPHPPASPVAARQAGSHAWKE